jgi:hypothetical protein
MKTNQIALAILAVAILFTACRKNEAVDKVEISRKEIDPSKVYKLPTTEAEKLLVKNLDKTTEIFKELYKDKNNIKIVTAAIYSKTYTDESVLLKDLLYPSNSLLSQNKKFIETTKKLGVTLESFSQNFFEKLAESNDVEFKAFLKNLNQVNDYNLNGNSTQTHVNNYENYGNDISIYYPYSEVFIDDNNSYYYAPITTIATATAEADEGWGSQPYYVNGVLAGYNQVLINDDYAEQNPTMIIGINGIEPLDYEINAHTPIGPSLPDFTGYRVYLGEVICRKQYDVFISLSGNGGGSEVKYCRLSAYLKPVNQQITTFEDIISNNFSRGDIKHKRWIRIMGIWDADWIRSNNEQILAIYEDDNEGTKEFNGTVSTDLDSLGLPIKASASYKVTVKTQDEIIRQLKITRSSYFGGAFTDQGQEFTGDRTFIPSNSPNLKWPAYEVHYKDRIGANVGWTWPYNSIN